MDENSLAELRAKITSAASSGELDKLRLFAFGRKGVVTLYLKTIGKLPIKERAKAGQKANLIRGELETLLQEQLTKLLSEKEFSAELDYVDITIPTNVTYGHAHPVMAIIDDLVKVFWQMGYQVVDGPEIETEWYNFEALNMPEGHPARDMQDTFYLEQGNLPRTHTSGVQVRWMEEHKPPIRVISPGKVYRNEDEDSRHAWMFYQVEGLVVDKNISLADLKGTLTTMIKGILGEDIDIRLRPSYFPYTEPSVELDATCIICHGKGKDCATCGGSGWLELGGAGMVHPDILARANIDPVIYSGFAFGFGPERIALIKYAVPDIREFWRPNIRFLRQFP
ncbi:MAG: phenylalanine--tRNA ligase subunit alpha [Candidatus Saccharimonadia bacterium]